MDPVLPTATGIWFRIKEIAELRPSSRSVEVARIIWPATTSCWTHTMPPPAMSVVIIFKHTEKFKERYKEHLYTLHLDSTSVIIFPDLSLYIPKSRSHPTPKLFKSKLLVVFHAEILQQKILRKITFFYITTIIISHLREWTITL